MKISLAQLETLKSALLYLRMAQLRALCLQLQIPDRGLKLVLIENILSYLTTGNIPKSTPIPATSKAKLGTTYPLSPATLILSGSYKNDLKTRLFMQKLVGSHFHFTAHGIDWLKTRWQNGQPPTYQEFADYWQESYLAHQKQKPIPKAEWAYINYVQTLLAENPNLTKTEVTQCWLQKQAEQVALVEKIIKAL
ncbi:MAG TPA: DUF6434 domain-containing protein [Candidatus Babeliales bacterium]|nr:DUF6434 domain-containing protein [Candidatus Babeliales bacterium]